VALVERRAVEVESAADAFVVLVDVALVVAIVAPTAVADVDVVEFVAIVDEVVTAIAVADVDVVVVVAAAVVGAVVVAVVGGLAAVQLGRLEQGHGEGVMEQSCGFR
jgi:hypothetical protein